MIDRFLARAKGGSIISMLFAAQVDKLQYFLGAY
jgi:hypothetical protein